MLKRAHLRILLALCIGAILYLSLYPFTFMPYAKETIAWQSPRVDSDWVDVFANFLLYIPLGFLLAALLRPPDARAILWATLLGATMSFAIELAQMYIPQRDSSFRDLACNATGAIAGSLIAVAVHRIAPDLKLPSPSPLAGILVLLWTNWQTYPFFPSLRRPKLHDIEAHLPLWNFHTVEFGDVVLAAFVLYAFLTKPTQKTRVAVTLAGAALFVVLVGQSLILEWTYSNARLAAAAAGLLAAILIWRPQSRILWIALATSLAAWIVFRKFHPEPELNPLSAQVFFYFAAAATLYRVLQPPSRYNQT